MDRGLKVLDACTPDVLLQKVMEFLTETKRLLDNMDRLMTFAPSGCRVAESALAKLDQNGRLEGHAVWTARPEEKADAEKRFLGEILPAALEKVGDGGGEQAACQADTDGCGSAPARSFLIHPLRMEGHLNGIFLAGRSKENGPWTPALQTALRPFLTLVELVTSNRRLLRDYTLQNWVFNEMMDNMSVNIYVTDVDTDEILFMNKTMKETFHLEQPEKKTCWKTLQKGMSHRCAFCPVEKLMRGEKSLIWEETNSITGRIYENYDSLMRWIDGRIVHFQQSVDITERKLLTKAASYDELTDLLNRRAGKEALARLLREAEEAGKVITICMVDIDGLKIINDTYGHAEGDRLLAEAARVLQENIAEDEYAFRLGGDEFVLVLRMDEESAAERMEAVARSMREIPRWSKRNLPVTFSYGLLEVWPGSGQSPDNLLNGVDEKMYRQKRRRHIELAQRQHAMQTISGEQTQAFDYDKEHLHDALIKSTDDYIYVCNMKTNTFRYPPAMVEEFGLPAEIISNAAVVWGAKVHEQDRQAFLESNQEIADGRTDCHSVEYRAKNRHGEWVWLRCRGHLERDEQGRPQLFAGMITNLGRHNKVDHLTGLMNKFAFETEVQRLLETAPEQPLGLMMLGLDEFRHINDLYDRLFGDEVIRIISQKMQTMLPATATLYRLDGDEFGVIFRGGSREAVRRFYGNVQEALDHQQVYEDKKYYCTISGGCAFSPENGSGYLQLIKYANYSLEYAKSKGKNRMYFFSDKILEHKERSLELTELLRESVDNGFRGFELYYQPQVYASDGRLRGMEVLCRWKCERFGPVPPSEFIPLLEESGMILTAGKWIFEETVKTCARWHAAGAPPFTASVNLSCLQIEDSDFLNFMEETLRQYRIPASMMEVELTESYIASNIETLAESFRRIRRMGLSIAMDDFGTGYSSLGILKLSPADVVKIDRTFVKGILTSTFDATFIRFIVELCHDVGIRVCLEGVETAEEYALLRSMQPDYIQGFYFGRPMPAADFEGHFLFEKTGKDVKKDENW